ncbi:MAG: NUDIX hydrolase [Candidatus Aenigmatarchaeota archaeon]
MTKKRGPWLVNKSEIKYKNPWMEVVEDHVIRPDGKDGIFGTVKLQPGVGILSIDDQGFVYLTEEFHYAVDRTTIEIACGAIENNESLLGAAKRELKEELGITAEEWISLGSIDQATTTINAPIHLFLARQLTFGEPNPDSNEIIKLVKISLHEAVNMVMDSRITQAASCALILKANKFLKN